MEVLEVKNPLLQFQVKSGMANWNQQMSLTTPLIVACTVGETVLKYYACLQDYRKTGFLQQK